MGNREQGTGEPGAAGRSRAGAGSPFPVPGSLVIQTSFLGDTVLTTPLIAELARRGPVDVVVTAAAAPLLADNPAIRDLIVYDKRGRDAGLGGLLRVARGIARRRAQRGERVPPVAYLAQGSIRSAALALLAGARERVGFDTSAGRRLYTTVVPHRSGQHHVERLWRLAFPGKPAVEPGPDTLIPRLFPGDAERAAVDALIGPSDGRALVAVAPGSAWATKRWPYYPQLAQRLASRSRVVVVGGADDRELARAIVSSCAGYDVLDATGSLSLLASAELIRRAALLVTNDSLPQHLASAMGTPTVTIFGPTVPAFGFGPLAPGSRTVGHSSLDCRPCHHHGPPRCPLGHWRCMRELGVEEVLAAVDAAGANRHIVRS